MHPHQTYICFALLLQVYPLAAIKLLLVPSDIPSDVSMYMHIGNLLISRGHDVTMVLPEHFPARTQGAHPDLKIDRYKMDMKHYLLNPLWQKEALEIAVNGSLLDVINFTSAATHNHLYTCEFSLKDKDFVRRQTQSRYDMAFVDVIPCSPYLPYKLGIPFATIGFNCYQPRLPMLPSVIPFVTTGYTERMSFKERLINFLLYWATELYYPSMPDTFSVWVPEKPTLSPAELLTKSEACLMMREHVTDFPRPMPAHAFYFGSILARDVKPLPPDVRAFVEEAKEGVIVVTFGTWLDNLPRHLLVMLMEAFQGLQQRVIMRYRGNEDIVAPNNVKLLKWLPQNDLLGHPKTRLAIHHGGANTLNEVAFHGVPSIVIPFLIDQHHNAAIAKSKGYGITLEPKGLTAALLRRAIQTVLSDKSILTNAKNVGEIMKQKQNTSKELFEHTVQYLNRFGGKYLKAEAYYDMPGYQFYSEDVKVFIFSVIALIIYIIYKIIGCCCKLLLVQTSVKKKQD